MQGNEYELAGFWRRFGAVFIDGLIIGIVSSIAGYAIYGSAYWYSDELFKGFWDLVINFVFPITFTVVFWVNLAGTPGKIILDLKLVDEQTGANPTLKQSVIRYFGYILSTIPLFLGYFWMLLDQRKQTWHDKLAGTLVIREREDAQDVNGSAKGWANGD